MANALSKFVDPSRYGGYAPWTDGGDSVSFIHRQYNPGTTHIGGHTVEGQEVQGVQLTEVEDGNGNTYKYDPAVGTWTDPKTGQPINDQQYNAVMAHARENVKKTSGLNGTDIAGIIAFAVIGGAALAGAGPFAGAASSAGGAAGAAGAAEVGAGLGAAEVGALAGTEAAMLGGPAVGTGLELTAAQFAAASQSPEVFSSIAKASGMTEAELTAYMANPSTTYPGGSPSTPASTTPTSTTPATTASTGSNSITDLLKNNKELVGIGSSIIGGITGSSTAKNAASQQQEGIDKAIAELRRQSEQGRTDLAPYRERGYQANDRMSTMMGINQAPAASQSPLWNTGYQAAPQYQSNVAPYQSQQPRNSLALPMKIIKGY